MGNGKVPGILYVQVVDSKAEELEKENERLKQENKELFACCSLEKKFDYTLKQWLNSPTDNLEIDRQLFALKLAEIARKDLQ